MNDITELKIKKQEIIDKLNKKSLESDLEYHILKATLDNIEKEITLINSDNID